jgi:hypothetical protein
MPEERFKSYTDVETTRRKSVLSPTHAHEADDKILDTAIHYVSSISLLVLHFPQTMSEQSQSCNYHSNEEIVRHSSNNHSVMIEEATGNQDARLQTWSSEQKHYTDQELAVLIRQELGGHQDNVDEARTTATDESSSTVSESQDQSGVELRHAHSQDWLQGQ